MIYSSACIIVVEVISQRDMLYYFCSVSLRIKSALAGVHEVVWALLPQKNEITGLVAGNLARPMGLHFPASAAAQQAGAAVDFRSIGCAIAV